MNAAIAEARRTLPQFLVALANPPTGTGDYGFKYPLAGHEHIWVDHVAGQGDALTGRLANAPMEKGFRQGQTVTVPLTAVSDWAYRDADGVLQGHRTTRVLLPQPDPAQAKAVGEGLGGRSSVRSGHTVRRIFAIALPLASSSINLST